MLNFITQLLSAFFPSKVMYIGGSDILPPPLSGAEEQQLLAQAAAGNDARIGSCRIDRSASEVARIGQCAG